MTAADDARHALAAFICMLLSGCGGNDIAGTYTCENVGFVKSIELTPGGKIYTKAEVLGETQQTAGTYEIDGTRLVGTVDGTTTVMDIENGILVYGKGKCVPGDYPDQNASAAQHRKGAAKSDTKEERRLLGTYRIDIAALMNANLESLEKRDRSIF